MRGPSAESRALRYGLYLIAAALVAFFGFRVSGNLGALVVIVFVAGALAYFMFGRDRRGAVEVLASDDGVHRILVMAHEGLGSDTLIELLDKQQPDGETVVHIVVPALGGRLKRLASDIDDETQAATEDLTRLVREMNAQGRTVEGAVGDSDPRLALEDALRHFPADEVVVVNPEKDDMDSLERSGTQRAVEDVDLPVTVLNGR